jgi:hypothetical protein
VRKLGAFGTQKFAARGRVVEEIAHFDQSAARLRRRCEWLHFTTLDTHFGGRWRAGQATGDTQPRHAADGR